METLLKWKPGQVPFLPKALKGSYSVKSQGHVLAVADPQPPSPPLTLLSLLWITASSLLHTHLSRLRAWQ